ncbi:MAG: ATP-dependent metallopeptidase FtsH/Yme1/Tma family protein, partial [Actinomycetota bacterium]|nr:ATP-dependent metallopeptidase FtsH/Yme1/Tma family protein [Actinomycetota bacterium]
MSRPPNDLRPGRPNGSRLPGPGGPEQNWRWAMIALFVLVVGVLILPSLFSGKPRSELTYNQLIRRASEGQVASATVSNDTGRITGDMKDGTRFEVKGPVPLPDSVEAVLRERVEKLEFDTSEPSLLGSLLPFLFPLLMIVGLMAWMSRRAQGQMTGLMSIGRSRAKMYATERPKTTFNDVAGYEGVKQEIR